MKRNRLPEYLFWLVISIAGSAIAAGILWFIIMAGSL
jgi:hypothetical protein